MDAANPRSAISLDERENAVPFPQVEQLHAMAPVAELPNALTCDVEDYFQVSAFEHLVPKSAWHEWPCRVEQNMDRILEIYAEHGAKGTFFTLGWIAEHYPNVVRKIAAEGHEVASHGYQHERVWNQEAESFRDDIDRTRKLLQDLSGQRVVGFRAASWSLDQRTPWAHAVMAECGYTYSSSIYPISHDHYGLPDAPLQPFIEKTSGLLEVPASTSRLAGRNLPSAGGGYFRLFPLPLSRWLINRVRRRNGVPAVFYFHPWEIDPDQPRMAGITLKTRFRHYVNLGRFESRLRRLLQQGRWERMDRIYLEC
ncbi:MAG: XrtA system polysaccharide deacetylase [Pseudomonadota bacterium]